MRLWRIEMQEGARRSKGKIEEVQGWSDDEAANCVPSFVDVGRKQSHVREFVINQGSIQTQEVRKDQNNLQAAWTYFWLFSSLVSRYAFPVWTTKKNKKTFQLANMEKVEGRQIKNG